MRGERGFVKVERMPKSYLPYEPTQDLLLPHSLGEWLPEDHLAHFVSAGSERVLQALRRGRRT